MFRGLHRFGPLAATVVFSAVSVASLSAATYSIVDGEGFEAPEYSTTFNGTGSLEGQFGNVDGGAGSLRWAKSGGAGSTATLQNSVAKDGSQSVQVDKAAGPDAFWGIQQSGFPDPGAPYVCIEWDMLVEASMGPTGGNGEEPFGPYFGVFAYDSETTQRRLGYLGVDSETGDVLYGDATSDTFAETGTDVTLGAWHKYQLILDYNTNTYSATVDGALVLTGADISESFIDGPTTLFTDANISAISAGNDAYYSGLPGTAYFDNFNVFETDIAKPIPEPATFCLLTLAAGVAVSRRRR